MFPWQPPFAPQLTCWVGSRPDTRHLPPPVRHLDLATLRPLFPSLPALGHAVVNQLRAWSHEAAPATVAVTEAWVLYAWGLQLGYSWSWVDRQIRQAAWPQRVFSEPADWAAWRGGGAVMPVPPAMPLFRPLGLYISPVWGPPDPTPPSVTQSHLRVALALWLAHQLPCRLWQPGTLQHIHRAAVAAAAAAPPTHKMVPSSWSELRDTEVQPRYWVVMEESGFWSLLIAQYGYWFWYEPRACHRQTLRTESGAAAAAAAAAAAVLRTFEDWQDLDAFRTAVPSTATLQEWIVPPHNTVPPGLLAAQQPIPAAAAAAYPPAAYILRWCPSRADYEVAWQRTTTTDFFTALPLPPTQVLRLSVNQDGVHVSCILPLLPGSLIELPSRDEPDALWEQPGVWPGGVLLPVGHRGAAWSTWVKRSPTGANLRWAWGEHSHWWGMVTQPLAAGEPWVMHE